MHFLKCRQGEFVKQSRDSSVIIISFILITLMFDSGVILKGEIRCWSLSGIKGLSELQGLFSDRWLKKYFLSLNFW